MKNNVDNKIKSGEKLDELFFDFIDKLAELGKYARTELSHSNFTHENKDVVIDTIKEYDNLLKVVNDKFYDVKNKLKDLYNYE